jgi:aspartate-semialdehyde dehydrogenase
MNHLKLGMVGASGLVGIEMLKLLEQRAFPVAELRLFASARSVGKQLQALGSDHQIQALDETCFEGLDLVFLDASDPVSEVWVPVALRSGATVIDISGAHRMKEEVPLIVPEVNGALLDLRPKLVASPNCTVAQLVVPLAALDRAYGIEEVMVSTYQSVSGAGGRALHELENQILAHAQGTPYVHEVLRHPVLGNCIPEIGKIQTEGPWAGLSSEEIKVLEETRKILGKPNLPISCMAVRVPTFRGHAETVWVRLQKPCSASEAQQLLGMTPGVKVIDDPKHHSYPLPRTMDGQDEIGVGRIHQDPFQPKVLKFWIVADNLLKGAALNAIQIAEWMFFRKKT